MNPYLAPELAEARMRRIGAMPTEWSATDIQIRMLSGELSAEAMAEMILQADVRGEKLRLLAPGTLLADWECVPHAILHAFDCDAVRRETLGFAVKTLCHREVRALPSVHAWYVAEARRLSEAIESGVSFVPENAREAAVYGIVREGH